MKKSVLKITASLFFLVSNLIAVAQPAGGPNNPNPVRDPEDANIDSPIVWLFALAVLLGMYATLKQQKRALK